MKLTKILLEYPGAFTTAPDDEREKNRKDMEMRRDPDKILQKYLKKGKDAGDLSFSEGGLLPSLLTSLPDNLTVYGDLDISDCSDLEILPDNLVIHGSLYMDRSGVQAIPEDIKVGKSISAADSALLYLPDNLFLSGDLIIDNTDVRRLPDNLTVKGELYASNSSIENIPNNLNVGILYIEYTPLIEKDDGGDLIELIPEQEIIRMIEDKGGSVDLLDPYVDFMDY